MLLDLDSTTLEMVRGDTFILPLPINGGSRENFIKYELLDDEYLYIGIMKPNQAFECAEIRCKLNNNSEKDSDGNYILKLLPEHTINLYPGKYYMTVKFTSGKDIHTLIDSKLFFLTGSCPVQNER